MKKFSKLINQFRSSIFAEYLPILFVVFVSVFALMFFVTKDALPDVGKEGPAYEMPNFHFPLRYFPSSSFAWGSANTSIEDTSTWRLAAIGGTDAFQSFPTQTITLSPDDFSNKKEKLRPLKSREGILFLAGIFKESFEGQIDEFGDLARRFLPDYSITDIERFDVDNDGKDEAIIGLCSGGNHCPHEMIIVQDEKIIFSVSAGLTGKTISKTETGNGFYVHWVPTDDKWDEGLCCPIGYMKTRFVFENDTFVPVYEQEVLYFKVENTD